MKTEQGLLRVSIAVTILLAGVGILFGILSGSFAIVFDGVYALTDAAMTVVALLVSNLIASSAAGGSKGRLVKHFTMGFWHLEPMVLGLNGILLTGAAIYALINAVGSIMEGGRPLDFDRAIIYAVVTLVITIAMAIIGTRANRTIQSDFVALDAKAWMMSAGLTSALLVAFVIGFLIQGTAHEWLSPYIDPVALALVCLVIIPIPAGTIRQAFADILLVTPPDLKSHVDRVAEAVVERHGFLSYRAYVARVGRGRQIELYFIVPEDFPAGGAWDSRPEGEKTPYVFLNHSPSALARAALDLGFVHTGEVADVEPAANLWFIEGNRDFSALVKYECRLFEGGELYEVIKAGWPHGSEDGRYIKWCLDAGPSFACYDGGKIVCASSTHLSGTMGMIYTPDEYRGKGYASSLAAFQTTEMLRRNKIAIAHIWHSNEPSRSLVKKLGFSMYSGWFGWWRMSFPN